MLTISKTSCAISNLRLEAQHIRFWRIPCSLKSRRSPGIPGVANRQTDVPGLRHARQEKSRVPSVGTSRTRAVQESPTSKLAKFFSDASPVRIPVQLTRIDADGACENTVIEYGTPREILFASRLALQFADLLRVQNSDGSLDVEASVVALQYNGGRTAVAARFTRDVPNWILKSGF
jgi:hypothetical protein